MRPCVWVTSISVLTLGIAIALAVTSETFDVKNQLPLCQTPDGSMRVCEVAPRDALLPPWQLVRLMAKDKLYDCIEFVLQKVIHAFGSTRLPPNNQINYLNGTQGPIEILRDNHGIAHVTARSIQDGIYAQGYIEAQDRLYQIEVGRRLAKGRLSELFGEKAKETDRFTRTLGFYRLSEGKDTSFVFPDELLFVNKTNESKLDTLAYTESFLAGLNSYMQRPDFVLPAEFALLGVKSLDPFTVEDLLAWTRMNCFLLSKGWSREISLSLLGNTMGRELLADLLPLYSDAFPIAMPERANASSTIRDQEIDGAALGQEIFASDRSDSWIPEEMTEHIESLPSAFGGSNAFAIHGNYTAGGVPILGGDPHLLGTHPSAFYRWNLHVTGGEEKERSYSGVCIPLVPSFTNFHSPFYSTGTTLANIDVDDTYIVRYQRAKDPSGTILYEHNGSWEKAIVLEEEIAMKGAGSETIQVIYTRYGVVISDSLGLNVTEDGVVPQKKDTGDFGYWLVLKSSALQPDIYTRDTINQTVIGFSYNAMLAETASEYQEAIDLIYSPPLNFVYADKDGNIGHFVSARTPIRKQPTDGLFPSRTWLKENKWIRLRTSEETPRSLNPSKGYVVSSNNKISDEFYPIINTWAAGYRAMRISDLIQAYIDQGHAISFEDVRNIQLDVKSLVAVEYHRRFFRNEDIAQLICPSTPSTEEERLVCDALEIFRKWDGQVDKNSAGAAIYEALVFALQMDIFYTNCPSGAGGDICLGKGHAPVINPSTELAYPVNTAIFTMWDAYQPEAKETSRITQNMRTASTQWMEPWGGPNVLMQQSFTKAVRWLAQFFTIHRREGVLSEPSSWRWGEMHRTSFNHNMGALSPLLARVVSPSGEGSGDADTVQMATTFAFRNSFDQLGWGVCYRYVGEHTGERENAGFSVLPPGNSGQIGSVGYSSSRDAFFAGELLQNRYRLPASQVLSNHTLLPWATL